MINKIFNFRNLGLGLTGGATALAYRTWIKELTEVDSVQSLHDKIEIQSKRIEKLLSEGVISENTKNKLVADLLKLKEDACNLLMKNDSIVNMSKRLEQLSPNSPESKSILDQIDLKKVEFNKEIGDFQKLLEKAVEYVEKSNSGKFIDNLEELINSYKDFLSSLNIDQLCQLISITSSSIILICLFNIVIIYYSNYIIDYLKLEERFPKLAKFLKIRKMYQNFNIFLNFLIILIVIIFIIYVNFSTLFR